MISLVGVIDHRSDLSDLIPTVDHFGVQKCHSLRSHCRHVLQLFGHNGEVGHLSGMGHRVVMHQGPVVVTFGGKRKEFGGGREGKGMLTGHAGWTPSLARREISAIEQGRMPPIPGQNLFDAEGLN